MFTYFFFYLLIFRFWGNWDYHWSHILSLQCELLWYQWSGHHDDHMHGLSDRFVTTDGGFFDLPLHCWLLWHFGSVAVHRMCSGDMDVCRVGSIVRHLPGGVFLLHHCSNYMRSW